MEKVSRNSRFSNAKRYGKLACLLFIFYCQTGFGQLRLVPLQDIDQTDRQSVGYPAALRTEASLTLPFFDDFSSTKNRFPDTKRWEAGSGVYINNSLTSNHPSVNIATFDGLNANGIPYNIVAPLTQGFTDTLTSQPLNLAGKTRADSIYLSFYWSAKGLGELPDSSDYIQLEFLSNTQDWVVMWKQVGYKLDANFHQVFIGVKDAAYFHGAFQFRFRTFGRSSGPYDTWHLDYVYLNSGRSVKQPYIFDVAARKQISSFLKRYTAMPLRQYLYNPAGAIADSVGTDLVNNFNNFNILTGTFTITNGVTGAELYRNVQRSIYIESLKSKSLGIKASNIVPASSKDSIWLVQKFFITTTDTIPGVNLKNNDTISTVTHLADYYAYDDGSAEYGVQVNQKLGRAAVRFIVTRPDTIGGVRMSLLAFNKDISGQSFVVQLLSNKGGKPDQILTQRAAAVRYPDLRDGFVDYPFGTPIAIADTFYVAWMQVNDEPLTIGFDRNSTFGKDHVYYNLGTEWVKDADFQGSIMIRPYLGKNASGVVTGTEPQPPVVGTFFPNPNKGLINWNGTDLSRIDIYNTGGKFLQTILPQKTNRSADLHNLPNGLYIIRAEDGKRTFVQKLLINK